MLRVSRVFVLGFVVCASSACMNDERFVGQNVSAEKHGAGCAESVPWSYTADTYISGKPALGPASRWAEKYPNCEGGLQSPIDIRVLLDSDEEVSTNAPQLSWDFEDEYLELRHDGNTVHVVYSDGILSYDDQPHSTLRNWGIHFHHPAEHSSLIGPDVVHAMEMHMVTEVLSNDGDVIGHNMIAVFIDPVKNNEESNSTLDEILRLAPGKSGDLLANNTRVKVNGHNLLPPNGEREHIRYLGTLSTPPCDAGVTWIVYKQALRVKKKHINNFKKIFPNNARPIAETFVWPDSFSIHM